MYMIWFVLNDPERLDDLLDAWEKVGVTGATIIESTGFQRRRKAKQSIPMRYMFGTLGSREEVGHYTLMAIVENEQIVSRCLEATEALVGGLENPNTGVFSSWPLTVVKGVPKNNSGFQSGSGS